MGEGGNGRGGNGRGGEGMGGEGRGGEGRGGEGREGTESNAKSRKVKEEGTEISSVYVCVCECERERDPYRCCVCQPGLGCTVLFAPTVFLAGLEGRVVDPEPCVGGVGGWEGTSHSSRLQREMLPQYRTHHVSCDRKYMFASSLQPTDAQNYSI